MKFFKVRKFLLLLEFNIVGPTFRSQHFSKNDHYEWSSKHNCYVTQGLYASVIQEAWAPF